MDCCTSAAPQCVAVRILGHSSSFTSSCTDVLQHGPVDDLLGQLVMQSSPFHPAELDTPSSKFSFVNLVPAAHDVLLVDAIVSQRNAQLASFTLQIAGVDCAIHKLSAIRDSLEQNAARVRASLLVHQTLASPVRRTPPEILGEVFSHCLPKTPYIAPRDDESPVVLTRVCRHWRQVALSTPRLWSSLSIHLPKAIHESYRLGCGAWLSRAKSVPLAVRILNDADMFVEDPALVSTIVHWLRPLVAQSNDLWWHGPTFPALFVPDAGIDLPLERLRITSLRDTPSVHFPVPAKHLRSASLQTPNHELHSLDGINLPWDNLVELNMHFSLFSSTVFVQLLTRCPHLRTLVASCLCADQVQLGLLHALPPGSITHPFLRRIEIKVIRARLDVILSALTLPALEELDVCFCYRERDAWPHTTFVEMIARSRCALKRLTVRSNKNAVPYFNEYTAAIPGLVVSTTAPDSPLR